MFCRAVEIVIDSLSSEPKFIQFECDCDERRMLGGQYRVYFSVPCLSCVRGGTDLAQAVLLSVD